MEVFKDQVYVLTIVPYRDSDLIINFLSRRNGKLAAVVYGGRKIAKSTSFPFQPGELIEMEYKKTENRDFVNILNTSGKKGFSSEQFAYERFVFHSYLIEIVSRISKPGLPSDEFFDLLDEYQHHNWKSETQFSIIVWVLWNILKSGGYQLDISCCHQCDKSSWKMNPDQKPVFRKQEYYLDYDSGAIICKDCYQVSYQTGTLSAAMLKIIWLFESADSYLDSFDDLPSEFTKSLARLLNSYLVKRFEISPKSLSAFSGILNSTV